MKILLASGRKEAEEMASLVVVLYTNPSAIYKKVQDISKISSEIQKIIEIETKIAKELRSIEIPLSTLSNGLKVPQKYAKQIETQVKLGNIATREDVIAFINRVETPLLTTFKETIAELKPAELSKAVEKINNYCSKLQMPKLR